MNGNCHFVFGASCTTALALNIESINKFIVNSPIKFANTNIEFGATLVASFIMGGLIGSIFPDIDSPNSYMGKLSAPLSTIIGKISKWLGKSGYRHRGVFHDVSLYIIGLVLSYYFAPYMIGFFVGALSHLFLDMFNPVGVPCFIARRGFVRLGKIESGSKLSIWFTYSLTFLVLAIGIINRIFT